RRARHQKLTLRYLFAVRRLDAVACLPQQCDDAFLAGQVHRPDRDESRAVCNEWRGIFRHCAVARGYHPLLEIGETAFIAGLLRQRRTKERPEGGRLAIKIEPHHGLDDVIDPVAQPQRLDKAAYMEL